MFKMPKVKFEKNQGLGVYARLLAGSDINVVHANISTAGYSPSTKTIYLPFFNKDVPEETKVHLSAHEVLHFLNPADYQYEEDVNGRKPAILNILDDCRIEKDGVKRFAGLNYYLKKSYEYLDNSGFLDGKGSLVHDSESLEKLKKVIGMGDVIPDSEDAVKPFVSRLNTHLKLNTIGRRNRNIDFSSEEKRVVKLCDAIETWEQVITCHDEVLKLHEQEMKDHPERFKDGDPLDNYDPLNTSDMTDENMEVMSAEEFLEKLKSGEIDPNKIKQVKRKSYSKEDLKKAKKSDAGSTNSKKSDEEKENSFDLNALFEKKEEYDTYTVDFGKTGLNNLVSYKEVSESIRKSSHLEKDVKTFLNEKSSTITDMVLAFNRLKNARQKLNQKKNITGELDFNKVVHYKTEEKIFKSKVVKNRKKNHGFVMLLDFSGSMDDVLDSLSDQIIRLASFCRRVNIPYKVYLFTSGGYYSRSRVTGKSRSLSANELDTNSCTVIYEALNSETPNQNEAMTNFKSICVGKSSYGTGSTPIYSSLLALPRLMGQMQAKYKLDKLNLFVFTDGGDTDGITKGSGSIRNLGRCTLQYKDVKATVTESPECYFDELNIFYDIYKELFNINISTFFMSDSPKRELGTLVSSKYNGEELFVLEDHWGDVFFTMGESYFSNQENDSLFVKTLMSKIM